MDKKNIAISGANGYLGSCVAKKFLTNNYFVKGLYKTSVLENLNSIEWVKWNLKDDHLPDEVYSSECFAHLASTISVDLYENISTDLAGLSNILNNKITKYIFFCSSIDVYGNFINMEADENFELDPVNSYGFTKLLSEKMIDFSKKNQLIEDYLIYRPSYILGPHKKIINSFWGKILKKIINGETIFISDISLDKLDECGVPWVGLKELSEWIFLGIDKKLTGIFNANNGFFSWKQFFDITKELARSKSEIIFKPDEPDSLKLYYDTRKFSAESLYKALAIKNKSFLEEILKEMIDFILNEDDFKNIKKKCYVVED
jgi:nucleoside-diphosphate-sugar epimerase